MIPATVKFLAATIEASRWIFDNRSAAVTLACARMGVEQRYAERAWDDHLGNGALPIDLHLGHDSIQTAVEMIRRDRFSTVEIAKEASPAKYVEVGMLEQAKRLAGVPANAIV